MTLDEYLAGPRPLPLHTFIDRAWAFRAPSTLLVTPPKPMPGSNPTLLEITLPDWMGEIQAIGTQELPQPQLVVVFSKWTAAFRSGVVGSDKLADLEMVAARWTARRKKEKT